MTSWPEIVFALSVAVPAYAYAGYPLLLAAAALLRPAPAVRRAPLEPTVSIVIVAHDEEATIERKILNCLDLDYPADRLEVLVASDGSTDRTDEVVRRHESRGVRLLSLAGPNGKPSALNVAVPRARGEIVVLCDARQRLDRAALRELVAPFADPSVGAVSGELHIESDQGSAGEGVAAYWGYEKVIRGLESRVGSTAGVTGALYAIRRASFPALDPRLILDDVAVPMAVAASGLRVLFEPRAKAFDRSARDAAAEYRRKVRTLAGNYQLVSLWPWLLNPARNPLFWQFVSHKLARLAVPWCLPLLFASSGVLALSSAWFLPVFAAQAAFYLLAGAGRLLEGSGVRLRVFSVPYAFVLLNVAAAAALLGFLRGTEVASWKRARA